MAVIFLTYLVWPSERYYLPTSYWSEGQENRTETIIISQVHRWLDLEKPIQGIYSFGFMYRATQTNQYENNTG